MTSSSSAPSSTWSLLARLWRDYFSRYIGRLVPALLAMIVLALTLAAIPFVVEAINGAFSGDRSGPNQRFRPSLAQVKQFGPWILVGLGLCYALAQYAQNRLTLGAALNTLRDIQNDMMARFLTLPFAEQQREQSGAIAARFTNDIQILRETLTRSTNGVRDVLQLLSLCATMIYYDVILFFAVIAIYLVLGAPIAWLGKRLRQVARDGQEKTGDVAGAVTQSVRGSAMIKSYGMESQEHARTARLFDERNTLLKRSAYLRAINEPFVFLVGAIAMAIIVIIMGGRVSSGNLDGPAISGFIVALLLLSQPARGLSTLYAVVQEGLSAFERILTIIDAAPEQDASDGASLIPGKGHIQFEDVSFSYDQDRVLNNITLDIPSGQTLALVGMSGAGKSTLTALLARLYPLTHGQILIDGQSISDVTLSSLRANIALVTQDAILFDTSLADNIGFGNPDASRDEIVAAAKAAAIHDFIEQLPNGYDTMAGENGQRLSGGQRQRISIARAFLKNAPILILDEPTSALDAETEAAVQKTLSKLQDGRTTIIIAHRLATIRSADTIAVLEHGAIKEFGTHEQLMANNSTYRQLVELQGQ